MSKMKKSVAFFEANAWLGKRYNFSINIKKEKLSKFFKIKERQMNNKITEEIIFELIKEYPEKRKTYKVKNIQNNINLLIESMNPGDQMVAGCFNFSKFFGGIF